MRENDDELSDIIQALAVERGRTGGFDESRLRDKFEVLGPADCSYANSPVPFASGWSRNSASAWDERYGQLIAYKQTHGDCNVPHGWEDNPGLGSWCSLQRTAYKNNKLSPDRIKRLKRLALCGIRSRVGLGVELCCRLPPINRLMATVMFRRDGKIIPNLVSGAAISVDLYKNHKLSADRINRLEQLGFMWDPHAPAWDEMFAALAAYKQAHGDCKVSRRWKDNPKLGRWCVNQRISYKNDKLSADRVKRLNDLGFVFEQRARADPWDVQVRGVDCLQAGPW